MKLLLGLDYELFFGRRTGTPERCLLEPTEALLDLGRAVGLRVCLFVDAGYLVALRREAKRYPRLDADFKNVADQLRRATELGHDVQLHVHPHWEDSSFDGEQWNVDVRRYRLQDFTPDDASEIVKVYRDVLGEVAGRDVFAYRAGGWCLQPFAAIRDALRAHGIWLDSTVFAGGYNDHADHGFDFRSAPSLPQWRFDGDPLTPVEDGYFFELPISTVVTGPLLYWRMAFAKLRKKDPRWSRFGDGDAIEHTGAYYLKRLLARTAGPASVDGVKAAYLRKHARLRSDGEVFNIMGHPKSMTRYSLEKLRELSSMRSVDWLTMQDFKHAAPRNPAAEPKRA